MSGGEREKWEARHILTMPGVRFRAERRCGGEDVVLSTAGEAVLPAVARWEFLSGGLRDNDVVAGGLVGVDLAKQVSDQGLR
jgi:hypothetical protein